MSSRHPQIAQREQRQQLRGVFRQPPIPHLRVAELPFDHPKRMLHLCPQAGLGVFIGVLQRLHRLAHLLAQARAQRNMPLHIAPLVLFALAHTLIARITQDQFFLTVQQPIDLRHIRHVGRRTHHRMHQARMQIAPDVRLHAEEVVIAFLGLVHLGVPRALGVLRRVAGPLQQRHPVRGSQAIHDCA